MAPLSKLFRDPFKRVLFELGADYYAHKLAVGPEADLRREFIEFLNLPSGTAGAPTCRILDVGCGPGHVARLLARRGYHVTGVDRSRRLLRIAGRLAAREGVPVHFQNAPAEKLPFSSAAFDHAYATGVIYWIEQPAATLREMVRVTRPGSMVASLDPHASMSRSRMRAYSAKNKLNRRDARKLALWAASAELNRRFEEAELRDLLTQAGLVSLTLERRLGGMVWFSKGTVPPRP